MSHPTASELALLKALWKQEPLTARELHERVGSMFDWSYSTTRKTLERMGEKEYLDIKDDANKKIYFAKLDKVKTIAAFAADFTSRVLELDGPLPAAMFGSSKIMDDDEIAELEKLLDAPNDQKDA